ncbi:MAG: hypothetical protein ACI8TX_004033 [Hyphomicrobiaceae bacterium]
MSNAADRRHEWLICSFGVLIAELITKGYRRNVETLCRTSVAQPSAATLGYRAAICEGGDTAFFGY